MSNIISNDEFLNDIFGGGTESSDNNDTGSDNIIDQILSDNSDVQDKEPDTSEPESDVSEGDSQEGKDDVQKKEDDSVKRFGLRETINTLLENETWINSPIKYGDKEYDSIQDLINNEKPTKEMFQLLSEEQKRYREEEISNSYIKVDDFDSPRAILANAILNGVPVEDIVEEYNDIQPLLDVDFTSIPDGEAYAADFVRRCLVEIDGFHPASVEAAIEDMANNYALISEAQRYQQILADNLQQDIFEREQQYAEMIQAENQAIQQDMINLRKEIDGMGIDKDFGNTMMNLRYKIDPDTGRYHYEELLLEKLKDKNFEARLMHFLLDDEDYNNSVRSSVKVDTQKKIMEIMKVSPGKNRGSSASNPSRNSSKSTNNGDELLRDLGLIQD